MDKAKLVEQKLEELFEKTQTKNYISRRMQLEIASDEEEKDYYKLIGKLTLSVSEDRDEWKEKTFEVMLTGSDADILTGQILAHLNSIPYEWGDMIFEDEFEDVAKDTLEVLQGEETEQALPA
jgi:hypothetical protein